MQASDGDEDDKKKIHIETILASEKNSKHSIPQRTHFHAI
jgi:hypothetical protein